MFYLHVALFPMFPFIIFTYTLISVLISVDMTHIYHCDSKRNCMFVCKLGSEQWFNCLNVDGAEEEEQPLLQVILGS